MMTRILLQVRQKGFTGELECVEFPIFSTLQGLITLKGLITIDIAIISFL